jgi:hypothetical protein
MRQSWRDLDIMEMCAIDTSRRFLHVYNTQWTPDWDASNLRRA